MKQMRTFMWVGIVAIALVIAAVPARSIADPTNIETSGISFAVGTPTPEAINVGAMSFVILTKAK
jgi:hypothetical protein